MKRFKIVLVLLLSISLTGCLKQYDLSEEQDDAVAEYMAGMLLENDKDYDQELIPIEEISTEKPVADTPSTDESISPTVSPVNTEGGTDNPVVQNEYTLSEVIGDKNFDIQYKKYLLTDSYPKNPDSAYFSLDASEGHQLLVISFDIKNITAKDVILDVSNAKILYRLKVNDGTVYRPMFTLLENDLHYFKMKVKGNDTVEAVLIYEISKDIDISDLNLLIAKDNISNTIEIK